MLATFWSRLRSHRRGFRKYLLLFATIYLVNLIYPFRTITPLAVSLERRADFDPSQHHVVVVNQPIWHEDVWMYLAGTLQSLGFMVSSCTECDDRGNTLTDTCSRFKLLETALNLGYYNGERYKRRQIKERLATPGPDGKLPSVVFMTTEIQDMQWYAGALWDMWQERPADQKFKVVALHHQDWDDGGRSTPFAQEGALEYLTISDHVTARMREQLWAMARDPETASYGYEHVLVNHVYPVVDVSPLVIVKDGNELSREEHTLPSRVIVVGKLEKSRRDYEGLIGSVEAELTANPGLWGYKWNAKRDLLEPIDSSDQSTFKLILFGEYSGDIEFDFGAIKQVVTRVSGYSQEDFYSIMAYIDLEILAWKSNATYYYSQVSGGVFRALEVDVPIITNLDIKDKLPFLDQEVSVVRPLAISDIEAVRWFRMYPNVTHLSVADIEVMVREHVPYPSHSLIVREIATMLRLGWRRSKQQFSTRRQQMGQHSKTVLLDVVARAVSFANT